MRGSSWQGAWGTSFFTVFEWVAKTEYQGRGTPHWHIAAWIVCFGIMKHLQGRTGTVVVSVFVEFLELLSHCEIDVSIGNGRLNYINGYVAKERVVRVVVLFFLFLENKSIY